MSVKKWGRGGEKWSQSTSWSTAWTYGKCSYIHQVLSWQSRSSPLQSVYLWMNTHTILAEPNMTMNNLITATEREWMDHCITVGGGVHFKCYCLYVHVYWICTCACQHLLTLELVPGVEDSHVCRYRVESTAPNDVHTFVSCLAAVVQLHALQKLYKARQKHKHTNIQTHKHTHKFFFSVPVK